MGLVSASVSPSFQANLTSAYMTGRDRQGWIYRSQLAYAVQELSQKHPVLASKADEDTLRMVRVIHDSTWGVFNIST
jgi:hypothetical protein